jgi:uncharacterized repeat protein (TIGR01451 family)
VSGDTAPRSRPGDLACFDVALTFPSGALVRNAEVAVTLPGNAAYQWYGTFPDHTAGSELLAVGSPTLGSTVVFRVGASPSATPRYSSSGQVFHVLLAVRIETNPLVNTAGLYTFSARASAAGTDGTATSQRRDLIVRTVTPNVGVSIGLVDVARGGTSLSGFPAAGLTSSNALGRDDVITLRVDIGNAAVQQPDPAAPATARIEPSGGQVGDALDVRMQVNLTSTMSCSMLSPTDLASNVSATFVLRSGARPLATPPTAALADLTCTGSVFRFTVPLLPAGYDLRVSFSLSVPGDAGSDSWYGLEAGVRQFTDRATTLYVPQANIDSSLAALGNWFNLRQTRWLSTASGTMTRTVTSSVVETGNSAAQATIGETVTYTVVLSLPAKSVVYQSVASSSLPANLDYVEGTAEVISSPLTPSAFGATSEPTGWDLAETANGWSLTLPNNSTGWRNDGATPIAVTIRYQAVVVDAPGNVAGVALNDAATWRWNTLSGAGSVATKTATATPVTVVEPVLSIARSLGGSAVLVGGSTLSVSLLVVNTAVGSKADDLSLTECVPAGLGTPTPVAPAGWNASVGVPDSCADGGRLLTFTAGTMAPGAQATLGYSAALEVPGVAGRQLALSGTLSARSLPSGASIRRTYQRTANGAAGASLSPPLFSGASALGQAARGQTVEQTFTVVVPANTRVFDGIATVTVASDLTIAGYSAVAPVYGPGCSVPGTVGHTITPSGQVAGWFLGDVVAGGQDCVVTLGLRAAVRSTATLGAALPANASLAWGLVDRDSDRTTLSTSGLDRSLTAGTSLTVVSPAVTIGRSIDDSDRLVEGGQSVAHTITVANAGNSAAYDIQLTEAVPGGLAATDTLGGTCEGAASPVIGGSLTWTLYSGGTGLQPGDSCTITYRSQLSAATALTDGQTLVSTATVNRYFGVAGDAALPAEQQVTYTGQSASMTLTAVRPTIRIDLTAADGSERVATKLGVATGWKVVVSNVSTAGPRIARGVDVVTTLPPNWTFTDVTGVSPARCTVMPVLATVGQVQTISWTNLCDLAAGEVLTIDFQATPQLAAVTTPGLVDGAGNRIVHDTVAALSAEDAGGTTLGSASNGAGATLESVDLQVVTTDASAADDGTPGSPGFVLGVAGSYYVDVKNNGPDPVAGVVTVTDTPPAGFLVTSATGTGWACSVAATVVCTNPGPVAVGENLSRITITGVPTDASLNDADGDANPQTGLVVNSVSVSSGQPDRRSTNDSDAEPTPVRRLSDMAISAAWSPTTPLVAGAEAVATITIVANGPSVAVGPVSVVDDLPTGLRLVRVRGTGWNCSASRAGTGYSAEANQNGRIDCLRSSNGVVASTALDPLEVTVQIDPTSMSATTLSAVVNHANDPELGNNTVTVSGSTTATSGLTVRVDDGAAQFTVGQRDATVMVTVTNQGPSVEPGPVVARTDLPVGLVPQRVEADGWSCTTTSRAVDGGTAARVSCTWVGSDSTPDAVGVGEVLPTIAVVLAVQPTAAVSSDPDAANLERAETTLTGTATPTTQTDGVDTAVSPKADVTVAVGPADPDPWQVGDTGGYAVVVTNNGPSPEYGPVTVSKPIPVGATFVTGRGDGWSCQVDRGAAEVVDVVTCTHGRPAGLGRNEGLLAAGESLSPLVIDVAVGPGLLPGSSASPVAVSGSASVKGATDSVWASVSDLVSVVAVADLAIERSGEANSLAVGEQATYALRITNRGPNPAAAGVVVTDVLPEGVELVAWAGEGFTCLPSATGPTCTYAEPIAVGDTRAVSLTVAARPAAYTAAARGTGTMSVSGPNIDRNPGDNDQDYSLVIEPLVDLAVEYTQVERLVVGRTTSFQLAVENLGPNDPASKVTLRNDLPDGLEYTEAGGDDWECATSGQRLECSYREALVIGEPLPVVEVGVRVLSADADGDENVSSVSATVRDADVANNEARTVLVVRMPESVVPELAETGSDTAAPVTTGATDDIAERAPNLAIGMYLDGVATFGGRAIWNLTVANTGAGDAYDVLVSNALPLDLAPVDVTSADGICAVTGQLVRCSFDSLRPDETRLVEVSTMVVGRGVDAVVRNTASVSGTRPELRADDNVVEVATRLGAPSAERSGQDAVDRGVDLPSGWARLWATVLGICGALGAVGLTYLVLVRPRRVFRRRQPTA